MDVTGAKLRRDFPIKPLPISLVRTANQAKLESEERVIVQCLDGVIWTDVGEPAAQRIGDGQAMGFMSNEAFAYYLPAFLELALGADPKTASWPQFLALQLESLASGKEPTLAALLGTHRLATVRHCVKRLRHRYFVFFDEVKLEGLLAPHGQQRS